MPGFYAPTGVVSLASLRLCEKLVFLSPRPQAAKRNTSWRRREVTEKFRETVNVRDGRSHCGGGLSRIMVSMIDREQAWQILCEFTKSEGLRKHALAVETCVTAYARKHGEDEAKWSSPLSCTTSIGRSIRLCPTIQRRDEPILAERGVDPRDPSRHPFPRQFHRRAAHLAARKDAVRLRRAGRVHHRDLLRQAAPSVFEVDVSSVRKKMKDKAFARSVSREDIVEGARELGVDLDEHIGFCIKAMQDRAAELGLEGTVAAGN